MSEFETTLEEDLKGDTSGYFGRLMVALCANGREPNEGWDMAEAEESAQKLYEVSKNLIECHWMDYADFVKIIVKWIHL